MLVVDQKNELHYVLLLLCDSKKYVAQELCPISATVGQTGDFLWLASFLVRGPESKVIAQTLHDELGVLVSVLSQIVELRNRILKGRARHFASLLRVAKHLVPSGRY